MSRTEQAYTEILLLLQETRVYEGKIMDLLMTELRLGDLAKARCLKAGTQFSMEEDKCEDNKFGHQLTKIRRVQQDLQDEQLDKLRQIASLRHNLRNNLALLYDYYE